MAKIYPNDPKYRSVNTIGLSVCDFWWTGLPTPLSILVFALLPSSNYKEGECITAFEYNLSTDGSLQFHRLAKPLISPMDSSDMCTLRVLPSGQIFLHVEESPPNSDSYSIWSIYVAGIDEEGEMFCRPKHSIRWPRAIDDAVSSGGNAVRVITSHNLMKRENTEGKRVH